MNWIDYFLLVLIVLGAVRGYREGFLMELLTLAGIILGILAGFKLMGEALVLLSDRIDVDEKLLPYIAFGIIFFLVLLIVTLIGRALKSSIDKTLLGRIDQAAGALLGTCKMVFILSVGLWILSSMKVAMPDGSFHESTLIPHLSQVAPAVTSWIAELIPAFGDVF